MARSSHTYRANKASAKREARAKARLDALARSMGWEVMSDEEYNAKWRKEMAEMERMVDEENLALQEEAASINILTGEPVVKLEEEESARDRKNRLARERRARNKLAEAA